MFHKPVSGLAGIAFLVLCAQFAVAQDFHVDTEIFDLHAPPPKRVAAKAPKPELVGACESLFHAGKVYDHNRGLKQMTIYEPAQARFVIVDDSRSLATRISFDEITDELLQARAAAQARLAEPEKWDLAEAQAAFIRFQLKPDFQEKFNSGAQPPVLDMTSPMVEYHVSCARHNAPEAIKAYLDYADWAARLSFVTRRNGMLPDARLAVNAALRRRNLLPVKVTLLTRDANGVHFRADHRFGWELNDHNRKMITHWDEKATAKSTKYVSWEEFFKATQQTAKRR